MSLHRWKTKLTNQRFFANYCLLMVLIWAVPSTGPAQVTSYTMANQTATEMRTWTSRCGNYTCNAALLRWNKGNVVLLTDDDRTIKVRFYLLSENDKAFVRVWRATYDLTYSQGTVKKHIPGNNRYQLFKKHREDYWRNVYARSRFGFGDSGSTSVNGHYPGYSDYSGYSDGPGNLNEVRIVNPNDYAVSASLRSDGGRKDFDVPANSTRSSYVSDGHYQFYFRKSNEPDSLYQGDPFSLAGNGCAIRIEARTDGNYGVRKLN